MRHRPVLTMALTVGCALVALAGCGSSASSSAGGATSSSSASAAARRSRAGTSSSPTRRTRSRSTSRLSSTTTRSGSSSRSPSRCSPSPATARASCRGSRPATPISKNGLAYTITLRKGVKFSNGTPMTSKDVQFSLEQTMAASQGWGYIDSAIKSVAAPSADTVVVNLKYKWAPILADLALFANGVVPDNYGGKTAAAFYQAPIGTGPFKFDYWHKGSALKLVKNTDYWQPGKPYLDSVTWTDVPNDNTRQLQVTSGQAQIDQFPAWSTVATLKSTPGGDAEPVPLDGDELPGLQRARQAVPGRERAAGDLLRDRPQRAGQGGAVRQRAAGQLDLPAPAERTTTPTAAACSTAWRTPRPRWPSPACRRGSPPRCCCPRATPTTPRSPRSCSPSSSRSAST